MAIMRRVTWDIYLQLIRFEWNALSITEKLLVKKKEGGKKNSSELNQEI